MRIGRAITVLFLLSTVAMAGDNHWTSGGPFGGNVETVSIHPQTSSVVFAGGEEALRSANAGSLWTSYDLGQGMVFRVNPKDPNMVIAAHGAVFQSNNQGVTWKFVSNNKFSGDYLVDFEFDPFSPSTLYGISFDHGVYKSVDGGKTWQTKNAGLNFKHCNGCYDFPAIEVDRKNANTIYVLLASRKVFKSRDGGNSWQSASNGLGLTNHVGGLAEDPVNTSTLYAGGDDGVFKTTDGGASWKSTNCGCQSTDLAVDFVNPQNVYVAYLGVRKSSDGGATWKSLRVPPPAFYLATVAARANEVFVTAYGAGIYRSQNGGGSWVPVNNGVNSVQATQMAANAQRAGLILATANNVLYRTTNSGALWQTVQSAASLDISAVAIHPSNASLVVGSSCCCVPAISTNGAGTWRCLHSIEFSSDNVALDPKNQQTIYLISHEQGVARSTNQGNSWSLANSGLSDIAVTSIAVDPVSTGNLFVGTYSGKVFKSANGASNWSDTSNGIPATAPIISIAIDPQTPTTIYALTDYQGKGVYKSTNSGQSWALKNKGLPTGEVSVTIHPSDPSKIFAGGYGGVYISTDKAESWSLFDANGLGAFVTFSFLVSPNDPNLYFAATQRGVYSYKRTVVAGGPAVDRVNPAAAKPGSVVTINGANFGSTQGNSKIMFGNVDAGPAISWNSNSIQVRVPSKAATGPMTVNVASTKSNLYTFVAPATTGNVTPTTGGTSGGATVTLTVPSTLSQLVLNLIVLFGGTVANGCYAVPPTSIVCPAPPAGTTGTVDLQVILNAVLVLLGVFTYGGG